MRCNVKNDLSVAAVFKSLTEPVPLLCTLVLTGSLNIWSIFKGWNINFKCHQKMSQTGSNKSSCCFGKKISKLFIPLLLRPVS